MSMNIYIYSNTYLQELHTFKSANFVATISERESQKIPKFSVKCINPVPLLGGTAIRQHSCVARNDP